MGGPDEGIQISVGNRWLLDFSVTTGTGRFPHGGLRSNLFFLISTIFQYLVYLQRFHIYFMKIRIFEKDSKLSSKFFDREESGNWTVPPVFGNQPSARFSKNQNFIPCPDALHYRSLFVSMN